MSLASAKTLTSMQGSMELSRHSCLWIHTGASPQLGFGHLRRCIVLAESLSDCCRPLFILDPEDLWSSKQLELYGFDYCNLKLRTAWSSQPHPHAVLLDTRVCGDLKEFIAEAREKGVPVLSIHDLGLNPLPSNIVVDGSIVSIDQGNDGSMAKIYSGTQYMILHPAFRLLHQRPKPIRKEIRSVFINLGGGDSQKYFLRVLAGLKIWGKDVDGIGLSGFIPWGQDSLNPFHGHPMRFHWESGPAYQYIGKADLAITAGGLSAYEALCAGVPLMALSYDALQQITIDGLESFGACIDLGPGNVLEPASLAEIIDTIDADPDQRLQLSENGRMLVDGLGSARVSQIIRHALRESETAGQLRQGA
jgi:spore coat polysaccharide biosynthesis predicted glycosyltransferase SpsG